MRIFFWKLSFILAGVLTTNRCLAQLTKVGVHPDYLPPRGLSFGASLAGNTNFSVQVTEISRATRIKNSTTFATGEILVAYTWPKGWRLESGLGVGSVAAVTIDAQTEFGRGSAVSFGTVHVPLRLYRYIAIGSTRFTISPHIGIQNITISIGEKFSARTPIFSGKPTFGSSSKRFTSIKQNTLTYQAGVSANYNARKMELGIFARYTNSFGNPVVALGRWEYDRDGIEQPALISESRLESISIGISIRRAFYAR